MFHRASIGISALRQVPLFQVLDDDQIGQIGGLLKEHRYHKGDTVFHQGDPGGCLYLVTSGRVRIFLNSTDGREATVRFYGPNSPFREWSNRSLREFAEAGLIRVERKSVTVLDRAGLDRRVQ